MEDEILQMKINRAQIIFNLNLDFQFEIVKFYYSGSPSV